MALDAEAGLEEDGPAGRGGLSPLHVPTVIDEVVDRLLTAIALGEFVPGERLPAEREMARLLHVSRNTVHEAFGRLRGAEIVEVRRGRSGGAYVRERWNEASAAAVRRTLVPRRCELEELCDLRCRYEELVARTAAERHDPAEGVELRRLVAVYRETITPQGQHAADIALHRAVLAATHNPQMAELSHTLLAKVSLGLPIEPYERRNHQRAAHEHAELVAAIVERRIEDAGRLTREHFSMSARTLRSVLEQGAAEATPDAPGRRGRRGPSGAEPARS